jgi:beta-N-acetylhexosaminidase
MRQLGQLGDAALSRRAARSVAAELRRYGYNLNFAPVLDVDSNPANPVIGDRALSPDPHVVAELGVAFAEGLAEGGVLACGKHFPGHGDTDVDSHLDLPRVSHSRSRLDAVELLPFRAAARAGIDSLMTAHVVIDAIDPDVPATLSKLAMTDLCRSEVGFEGVLFSDDLEMGALAHLGSIEQTSVAAIAAGCDVLLVCKDEALADRAFGALLREAEGSPAFFARCEESARRVVRLRQTAAARRARAAEVPEGALAGIIDEIARRGDGSLKIGADPTNPRPRGAVS